ncbi:hypothetical protein CANTEDRAFT_102954 [Yamadazyma tenuis ATCC 10573]|uniref:Uncharacterized protein n=1 Tax=Candida tenuis (strain ATCC 10573 / BCRC 21748 / CBS 615 / JCM 9827 / NBRC 10315 / NRRL Y-1498 / VKM Y-70) TaxID=590646 RepID=G3B0K8_CANTC|nr:uncharacterized protein CANTEDRAFT_102954 [Yamadazyma tenuis ATCC 10573]EGV65417.1 hypothetical protein CANTEDRAFT_102954 [Yamadazyma tenuis ATCC 10573]
MQKLRPNINTTEIPEFLVCVSVTSLKLIHNHISSMAKLTAQEKEAQIMSEIRASAVKFEPKFETSFFGNIFGFSVRTN